MPPIHFCSLVDDTTHWERQNYKCDHVANVREKTCGCGKPWQMDVHSKKWLHNVDGECAWMRSMGDIICSNYDKPLSY